MRLTLDPFRLLLISLAGCLNQHQPDVIDYLQEENRVLRQQLGNKRLRLNDDQRRRLAVKAKKLGWRVLHELTTIVTPETLLAWHRKLVPGRAMALIGLRMMSTFPSSPLKFRTGACPDNASMFSGRKKTHRG
jgi:hypothetical protein